MYIGILYTLITALLMAGADVLSKKASAQQSVYLVSLSRWLFAIPVLALMTFQMDFPRAISSEVIVCTLILIPLEIVAMILYVKAIAHYDLSLTVPLLSLTPLFLLITGSLFLHETVTLMGIAGVVTILSGVYIMNVTHLREGMLAPFKSIVRNEGSLLVVVVALIYAITSTMGKKVVTLTGSAFFSFWYLFALSIVLIPVVYIKGESPWQIFKNFKMNLLIGTLVGLATYSIFTAYNYAPIAYVIAIKRTSILFTVILGRMIFNEPSFGRRVTGAVLALIGIVLIILSPGA